MKEFNKLNAQLSRINATIKQMPTGANRTHLLHVKAKLISQLEDSICESQHINGLYI